MIQFREGFAPVGSAAGPDAGLHAVTLAEQVFARDGWLERDLGLAHREPQATMALHAAQAFADGEALLFEAGTGVGKSLAYLVPALLYAQLTGRPAVVSTHTIALQEQLLYADIELVRTLFRQVPTLKPFADFRETLLVGRGNYLCPTRLGQALATRGELFPTAEQDELNRLANWARETSTGLRHELDPAPKSDVWEWVNADASACNRRNCDPEVCFYQKARAELKQAHLIVVNHSLLFALLNAGAGPRGNTSGILFPQDLVVLDEAHTVPAVATENFGQHLSSYGLDRALKKLYHPKRQKGLLKRHGQPGDTDLVEAAIRASDRFFAHVADRHLKERSLVRLYEPEWAEPIFARPLKMLLDRLSTVVAEMGEGPQREELEDQRARVKAYHQGLHHGLRLDDDREVYWLQRSGARKQIIALQTAPIDVAPVLREQLFARQEGLVLTSATLAEGPTMDSFAARIGAEAARMEQAGSPFNYREHMRVFIATDAPGPSRQGKRLDIAWLADMIGFCTLRCAGGSLVLFTSYDDMRQCALKLEETYANAGRRFMRQERGGARSALAKRFREEGNAILFGTDTFWTGFDVPGTALSQVILTRLPFENPTHPIAEARSDFVRSRGGDAFAALTLPAAVVKFRQGIGRLIRTREDRGTITILDSRLLHKPYGTRFLDVLPQPDFVRFDRTNREERFRPLEGSADDD